MRLLRSNTLLLLAFLGFVTTAHAQVFSNKVVGKKHKDEADSLKQSTYPYILPIWGEKVTKRGFNLPYSAGISVQYFGQSSDLVIDNLNVGFNLGPTHNLDGVVRFDKVKSSSDGISLRPDVWVLPFLNVYGIFGQSKASTDVGYGIWVPDSSGGERQVAGLETKVDFDATTFGLGLTPTIGVGGGWLALDMNFTWTDVPQLSEPASAFVFDPRLGKIFTLRNPDENINFWVGGFRLRLNTGTDGSIPLGDALPIDKWQSSVNQGIEGVTKASQEIDAWWNGLTPEQQAQPVNIARHEAALAALSRASGFLDAANQAVSNASNSTVQYSLDKRQENAWNVMAGAQYQLNKSWMFRIELGGLTSRTHLIAGAQYRFGL
jgi:opacity protein-like surface antigen